MLALGQTPVLLTKDLSKGELKGKRIKVELGTIKSIRNPK